MGDEGYDDGVSNAVYYTIYILWLPPQMSMAMHFLMMYSFPFCCFAALLSLPSFEPSLLFPSAI